MEDIERIKKRIKEQAEKNIELDDSDIPIHERQVKEEQIKELKRKKLI